MKSLSILPAPFDWIEISGKGYSIAKYPITNVQFARFIVSGGYREPKWWTEAGWKAREEGWHYDGGWKPSGKPWTEPRYWSDNQWNGADQPVVGVSWYEAAAFCLWLSDVTSEYIMLPTEQQWQHAAQGDDGRDYPWGKDWDCQRCNNSVAPCDSKITTPVRQYEGKGDSPFGVVDMVGNVSEWCLTVYDSRENSLDATDVRVLRGGSCNDVDADTLCCDYRSRYFPHLWDYDLGFRLSRS